MIANVAACCIECGGAHVVLDARRAEFVCGDCGTVQDGQVFDDQPPVKWDDDDGTRVEGHHGPPMGVRSLMTAFYPLERKDANGNRINASAPDRFRMARMHRVQVRARSVEERGVAAYVTSVQAVAGRMALPPSVVNRAMDILIDARKVKMLNGTPIENAAAACLMLASKLLHVPRSADDFLQAIDGGQYSRTKTLGIYRRLKRGLSLAVPLTTPGALLPQIVSKLELPRETIDAARAALKKMENGSPGSPYVDVAGALYVACRQTNHKGTQGGIAKAAGVSEVSLRNRLRVYWPELMAGGKR